MRRVLPATAGASAARATAGTTAAGGASAGATGAATAAGRHLTGAAGTTRATAADPALHLPPGAAAMTVADLLRSTLPAVGAMVRLRGWRRILEGNVVAVARRSPIVRGPPGESRVVVAANVTVTIGVSVAKSSVDRVADVPVTFRRRGRLGQRFLDAQSAVGIDPRALTIEMLLHEIPLPAGVFGRGWGGIRSGSLGRAEAFEVRVREQRNLVVLGTGADTRCNDQHRE